MSMAKGQLSITDTEIPRLIRPLEGYRAIAILAVLMYHLDFMTAGFLGVDLFFIISGFIITRNIYADILTNTFSFKTFYFKRYRRLFPALIVTVIFTLLGGYIFLPPSLFESLGRSAVFSVLSLANVNFWHEAGYFDIKSSTKPLLHMWSLSVEEQFYLLWPALLLLLCLGLASKNSKIVWALVFLAVVSFVSVYWAAQNDLASTAFYWFPFRAFQFIAGAIIAICGFRNFPWSRFLNFSGLFMFCASCYFLTASTNIALTGLLVTISGIFLLLSMDSEFAKSLFGNPFMVAIGQHSYSLYLVHWPLIVFYEAANGSDLIFVEKLGLLGASVVLAILLRRLVEQPFRLGLSPDNNKLRFPTSLTNLLLILSLFASVTVWKNEGIPERIENQLVLLTERDSNFESYMRLGDCFLRMIHRFEDLKPYCYETQTGNSEKKNVLIIGSSLAADTYHGIHTHLNDWNVFQITSARCPPVNRPSKLELCENVRNFIFEDVIENQKYDLVILSGISARANLSNAELEQYFDERQIDFVVFGPRPKFSQLPELLINQHGKLEGLDVWMQSHLHGNQESAFSFRDKNYFSLIEAFCERGARCVWRDGNQSFYFDAWHLSPSGSDYLGLKFKAWLQQRDRLSP